MTTKMLSLYSTTMTEKMPSLYLSTINPHFSIISWKKKSFPVTGSRNLFTTTVHASRSKVDHQISRSQVIDWLIIKLDRLIKSIELINLFIFSKKKWQGHEEESLLLMRSVLGSMERVYLKRNPTAKAILDLVKSVDDADHICYDHLAFRTFGVSIFFVNYIKLEKKLIDFDRFFLIWFDLIY